VDHVSAALAGAQLAFERPAWLLLALATPLVFVVLRFSLADFSRRQLVVQGVLRALVLAGLALALARPTLRLPARAVSVVALADVSDSIPAEALARERDAFASLARAAERRGDPPPRLVRFASRPEEVRGAAGSASASALTRFAAKNGGGDGDGAATDLALAASFGAGLADTSAIPRLLLMSDGRPTRGDLIATAARLAARRLPIDVLPLPSPAGGDAAVVELAAPDEVRPRVPFSIDVRLLADRAVAARLRLDGGTHATVDEPERTLALAPGATTVSFTARVDEPGVNTFHAHLAAAGDGHPENDEGVLAIATERELRTLCLEGTPGGAGPLARALAAQRISADVRSAARLPRGFAFGAYDLVVLADVPRAALPDPTLAALEAFVRDGGGLAVAGGTQSYGPGGYGGTRLEGLLPVRLEVPDRREEATLALALVIDRSGSMAGAKMDLTKEAARATAEALPPSDQIAVVVFDSAATPVVRLQRAANRQRILADIARIQPSGGTNILAGLREAVDELAPARARKKHVILLSDGQSPYDEIPDLVDTAAASHITISAVGVGDGADQTLLKMIADRGGGRFYHTRDPATIPRIFSRETSELGDRSIVERPTGVRVVKRAAATGGIPLESAPLLGGYVVTGPRAQAETILLTADGAPLLARWQVGLGQVLSWTSDLGARWAAPWTRWPPFDKLWSQLARATMRRRAASHFPIHASRTGDTVQLTVEAVGADDRFLVGLDGSVTVEAATATGRRAEPRTLPLAETAPGLYEASFRPEIESGALLFQATLRAPGGNGAPIADASGRLTLPFAPELRPRPPASSAGAAADEGAALLATVAGATGGRVITDSLEVLAPGPDRPETRQPLRTPVLLATLALFLLDVLARRVRFPLRRGRLGRERH
jgi:uncharacterized membrane protein